MIVKHQIKKRTQEHPVPNPQPSAVPEQPQDEERDLLEQMHHDTGLSKRQLMKLIQAGGVQHSESLERKVRGLNRENSPLWYQASMRSGNRNTDPPELKRPLEVVGMDLLAVKTVVSRKASVSCKSYLDTSC
jgi:hypothetical protein